MTSGWKSSPIDEGFEPSKADVDAKSPDKVRFITDEVDPEIHQTSVIAGSSSEMDFDKNLMRSPSASRREP